MQVLKSLFPEFFDYQLVGIFLLRALVGLSFIWLGVQKVRRNPKNLLTASPLTKVQGTAEIIVGILFTVGLLVQAAAIAGSLLSIVGLLTSLHQKAFNTFHIYLFILVISVSFLVLGPGLFAFDLPF